MSGFPAEPSSPRPQDRLWNFHSGNVLTLIFILLDICSLESIFVPYCKICTQCIWYFFGISHTHKNTIIRTIPFMFLLLPGQCQFEQLQSHPWSLLKTIHKTGVWLWCECLELSPYALQEQRVLLTAKLSLQPSTGSLETSHFRITFTDEVNGITQCQRENVLPGLENQNANGGAEF